jgi:hypothetical protein
MPNYELLLLACSAGSACLYTGTTLALHGQGPWLALGLLHTGNARAWCPGHLGIALYWRCTGTTSGGAWAVLSPGAALVSCCHWPFIGNRLVLAWYCTCYPFTPPWHSPGLALAGMQLVLDGAGLSCPWHCPGVILAGYLPWPVQYGLGLGCFLLISGMLVLPWLGGCLYWYCTRLALALPL